MNGRRCRARHGQRVELQCAEMLYHEGTGCIEHWAVDVDGQTVRWSDLVAVYQVLVGEPGPEVVGNGGARLAQVGGDHYRKHKIQHWDIVVEYGLNYFEGAIVKYVLRHRDKNGVEDLKKARHTLDRLIEIEEEKEEG